MREEHIAFTHGVEIVAGAELLAPATISGESEWPVVFPPTVYYSRNRFPADTAMVILAGAMIRGGLPMNMHAGEPELAACCAFCRKQLPILNGELQSWRSPNGQFFCNEFCADDYEEVRFRKHSRADRKSHQSSSS